MKWDDYAHLLGTKPDNELAAELGVGQLAVQRNRNKRGIRPWRNRVSCPTAANPDVHWLAGLLEGEGSFILTKNRSTYRYARIVVSMVDEDVIQRVADLWETKLSFVKPSRPGHQSQFRAGISGQRAVEWMRLLRPLMGVRRQGQIDRVLAHEATRPDANERRRSWSAAKAATRQRDDRGRLV